MGFTPDSTNGDREDGQLISGLNSEVEDAGNGDEHPFVKTTRKLCGAYYKLMLFDGFFFDDSIYGTLDVHSRTIHHMGIDHGGGHVCMPQQFLDGADICSVFQQMGGEGVTKGMAAGLFGETCLPGRRPHGFL